MARPDRNGQIADAGERMVERLHQRAFLPDTRRGFDVRYGIAEAAAAAP